MDEEENTGGCELKKTEKKNQNDFKVKVDVSAIESVSKDQQALELQSLNLDVFDLNTLEKGIIAQVEEAIQQKSDEEDGESGQLTDSEDEIDVDINKVSNRSTIPKNRLAEIPKSVLNTGKGFVGIQRYLDSQAKLQKNHPQRGPINGYNKHVEKTNKRNFKNRKAPKEFIPDLEVKESKKLKPDKKPGKFLGVSPTKRKKKEKLGTRKSRTKTSVEPNLQPGEENYMYINTSGSEYVPSTDESEDEKPKVTKAPKKKTYVPPTSSNDTDDSDWESSDEDIKKKRKGKYELDDGDLHLYSKRIQNFKNDVYNNCHRIVADEEYKCPMVVWEKLYKYQKEAVAWFWNLNKERCGGILGDEMGLGKTVEMIAYLAGLYVSDINDFDTGYQGLGPTLVVCPTTLLHQWVREFHKWLPPVRAAILHESGTYSGKNRSSLVDSIHTYGGGVLITSYNGLVQHKDRILSKTWHYVILDEGHKIRNHNAQVTLVAKELDTPHRIILSGSPLQNNLKELWSLFDFIYPGKLGTLQVFISTFHIPIVQGGYANATQLQVKTGYKCATILKDTITPYLLRRMKSEVDNSIKLPPKTEQVLLCKLTEEQRMYYKHYVDNVDLEGMVKGRVKIFVGLINLRKICNHPDLYSGGPNRDFNLSKDEKEEERFGHWEKAGKMIVVETLLKIWHQQGQRVLLFTQSKKMLLILEDFVKRKGYKYLKLDGGTSISARQPMIDKYNSDSSYFVMLLTTKVGGLGINLTGANRVVIYDPDWNPATDTQARERAWRIGQTKDVTIYRLITAGTIEEKIYHRQIFKQFLSNKVLKDPRQRRFFKSNDLLELFTLSETVKDGTNETAAIFAGTGSEVVVPKVSLSRLNSLNPNETFTASKIEEMKKLAQQLSKKISLFTKNAEENKQKNNVVLSLPSTSKQEMIYGPDGTLAVKNVDEIQKNKESDKQMVEDSRKPDKTGNCGENDKLNKRKRKHSSTFEGQTVPHLVKCKSVKRRKRNEEPALSQDDYVLHKLFSKTGIETALKHDTIMEGGPSDYAIVEAEADRVAQDALRSLQESARDVPQVRKSFFKTPLPTKDTNLFSSIGNRNLDSNAGSNEKTLLRQMVNFINASGGTASTDQIVREFSSRVDNGRNAIFKSLLSKIAKFYRGPDKIGYWSIRDEFK